MNQVPSFYAIIPAYVRYSEALEPLAKLFYGDVSSLCNQDGYCLFCAEYFAGLYGVNAKTVNRWVKSLADENFIKIKKQKKGSETEVKIYINHQKEKKI